MSDEINEADLRERIAEHGKPFVQRLAQLISEIVDVEDGADLGLDELIRVYTAIALLMWSSDNVRKSAGIDTDQYREIFMRYTDGSCRASDEE